MAFERVVLMLALIAFIAAVCVEAGYKKPPFNGSIFGKRASAENDGLNRAMSAMCEVASEACSAWVAHMQQDS